MAMHHAIASISLLRLNQSARLAVKKSQDVHPGVLWAGACLELARLLVLLQVRLRLELRVGRQPDVLVVLLRDRVCAAWLTNFSLLSAFPDVLGLSSWHCQATGHLRSGLAATRTPRCQLSSSCPLRAAALSQGIETTPWHLANAPRAQQVRTLPEGQPGDSLVVPDLPPALPRVRVLRQRRALAWQQNTYASCSHAGGRGRGLQGLLVSLATCMQFRHQCTRPKRRREALRQRGIVLMLVRT